MDDDEGVRRTDLLVCSKARRGLTDSSISRHACSHPGTWLMIMCSIITCGAFEPKREWGAPRTKTNHFCTESRTINWHRGVCKKTSRMH